MEHFSFSETSGGSLLPGGDVFFISRVLALTLTPGTAVMLPVVCLHPLELGSAHSSQPSTVALIQTDVRLSLAFIMYSL